MGVPRRGQRPERDMADTHKNLWAPWRMEYIAGLGTGQNDGCFLCRAYATPQCDEADYVLWRRPRSLVILNRFPYASGHTLIAPAAHVAGLEDLPDDVLLELMQQTRDVKRVLQETLHAQGFNIGINLGHCAGAGLPGHLHIHVVPRWGGDTNFMAVLGEVTVIPQALAATRRLFLETAERLGCR
jgi:ATP adenylyltransferase